MVLGLKGVSATIERAATASQAVIQDATQRLSSGLRINSGSDDAAGLMLASKLSAESKKAAGGIRSINDGISLISVAEASLSQLNQVLNRLSEITTQGIDGVLSSSQRSALNQEVVALQDEFNRIVDSTQFNGTALFKEGPKPSFIHASEGPLGAVELRLGATQLEGGVSGFTGGTIRVSEGTGGVEGNGSVINTRVSRDGTKVLYPSLHLHVAPQESGELQASRLLRRSDAIQSRRDQETSSRAGSVREVGAGVLHGSWLEPGSVLRVASTS